MSQLARQVLDFYNRVRREPSISVGPELDKLREFADREVGAQNVALTSPVASRTWMTRKVLASTQRETAQEPIEATDFVIVGVHVVLLALEPPPKIPPPLSAIDIFLQIDRRDHLTASVERIRSQTQELDSVSLSALDAGIANRVFRLNLNNPQKLAVRFKWAVDNTIVNLFNWSNVQISVNWFVSEKSEG